MEHLTCCSSCWSLLTIQPNLKPGRPHDLLSPHSTMDLSYRSTADGRRLDSSRSAQHSTEQHNRKHNVHNYLVAVYNMVCRVSLTRANMDTDQTCALQPAVCIAARYQLIANSQVQHLH